MLITYCMKNKGLNLVICASDSSWLQNRMSSISQSLCHIVPGWNGTSWPRINPFSLLGCAAGMISVFALFFIDIYDYYSADAMAGIFISTLTCITMYPMSSYSAKILLQGTPPHVTDLLDKCLREASTLDGVLEFRNEHFWLLGFDKIVGTIHVRIRRDANEQIVLSHLLNKLSSLVTDITIQVFKDEWAWSSSTRQILNESFMKFPPITEVYSATSIPVANSSSTIKEALSSSNSAKTNSSSTYTSPPIKIPEQTHASYGYATIPLPPSLSGSQASKTKMQHFAVDMMPETAFMPKHTSSELSLQSSSKMYQTVYSQMPTSQASIWTRINY
ncbi:zinc transporter 6-A-like isoform X2 [Stegodyphus dumicola]|uniref:zinc transporter 6-A-like isoform X2 n=1 Tax=Stegodyphus dumicola TaxID=202533 RepID=UPI0015AB39AD|nr:zinc transporter 6-A-like isoform X2 [Stegodyphus dumicola]